MPLLLVGGFANIHYYDDEDEQHHDSAGVDDDLERSGKLNAAASTACFCSSAPPATPLGTGQYLERFPLHRLLLRCKHRVCTGPYQPDQLKQRASWTPKMRQLAKVEPCP